MRSKTQSIEQSVAHYTSQAKLWALRGCESTNKTVGRDYLHTLLNENKNKFQILAHTDSLTGIYNRYGFDEATEKMIDKNPKAHFIAALLDIDDFKFINDVYGHIYGDKALKSLADSMKAFFPPDVLLGRNGGDEFCILLPNYTFE